LSFRLLVVLLVPMAGLQVFAWREVNRQRSVAADSEDVRAGVEVMRTTGSLLVPIAQEMAVSRALVEGSQQGLDTESMLGSARSIIDDTIDTLLLQLTSLSPPNEEDILDDIDSLRSALTTARASVDAGEANIPSAVAGQLERVLAQAVTLNTNLGDELRTSASTSRLASIARQSDQVVAVLRYASDEYRAIIWAGTVTQPRDGLDLMLRSGGALDASMQRLRRLLDPDTAQIDELLAEEGFQAPQQGADLFAEQVLAAADRGVSLAASSDSDLFIKQMDSSVNRLVLLNDFATYLLDQKVLVAESNEHDAQSAQRNAVAVMVLAVLVSLVMLGLVVRSVLRPLRKLVRVSSAVRNGDLAVKPAKPTGPTDIRVVTRAFNDMVSTLKTYEQQLALLAQGYTKVDDSLPGPLGETVRRSVGQVAELTERLHESQAAAYRQSRTDALSGLANRTAALEQLAVMALEARQTGKRAAVVFVDLDGFKSVNDTQGHAEGDRVLVEIASRLRANTHHGTVARMGGDEFLVLLPDAGTTEDVVSVARTLIAAVSEPCTGSSGQLFALSASAGVAFVDGLRDPLSCIAQADTAVYHAKERGRGRVEVFDERLSEVVESRAEMALTMRQALAENQFTLRLQPIIEVATSRPVGAEVLLRWQRPGLGEIGPSEFIPIAERTGVIVDIESWVLEQAVGILRDWRIDPVMSKMRLAVNISGRHVVEGNLAALLSELCTRSSVDPNLLDLEITETHLVADVARAGLVVNELRSQGVNVAIDDFGTGYSSMTYLHRLTVDTLKIDQVFVKGMCDNRLDRTIVELLLRLGDSLGMKVVAEGVDSSRKLALLRELGCPWAQGYHIARPMGVNDAARWLQQQAALAASIVSTT
jgi:diguanylate cyclase (GGDEF)-like protein